MGRQRSDSLKRPDLAGVGSLIKNYIMFIPEPITIHPDSCADLASIWNLPVVKGKTRLNVLVMFTPQFHSFGPHSFNPKYIWKYYGLMLGFDPVAVDAPGLSIIEAIRSPSQAKSSQTKTTNTRISSKNFGTLISSPCRPRPF